MRKILGTQKKYYTQKNNAQVYLFDDYVFLPLKKLAKQSTGERRDVINSIIKHLNKYIACGPTSWVMGVDICGWPMDIFTSHVQPEDTVLMLVHNKNNLEKIKDRRNINYDNWPPNEVPQVYDVVGKLLYKTDRVCEFKGGFTYEIARKNIMAGITMMVSIPGHYILVVGFDDLKKVLICNDPYAGYNIERPMEKISNWRVDIYPYE